MNLTSVVSLFLGLVGTSWSFVPPQPQRVAHHSSTSSLFRQKLNDMDLMILENVAELCLQADTDEEAFQSLVDDCDLDEHEALVNQLQDQRDQLAEHLSYIDSILTRLHGDYYNGGPINGSKPDNKNDSVAPWKKNNHKQQREREREKRENTLKHENNDTS